MWPNLQIIEVWFWSHFVVLLKSDLDVQQTHYWQLTWLRHDTQQNDIQHNNTQSKDTMEKNTQHHNKNVTLHYAECLYFFSGPQN